MKKKLLTVFVMFGVGAYSQISFKNSVTIPLPKDPIGVIVKDLNNDHLKDVVVSYFDNNYISIFHQKADGTLSTEAQKIYSHDQSKISAFNLGDINQDGLPDLLISTVTSTGAYLMKQDGSFSDFKILDVPFPVGITIGDLNHDNINDLLLTSYNKMYFAYQKVDLPATFNVSAQDKPSTLGISRVADINNDGRNDIIFASSGTAQIFTYRQKAEGGFDIPVKTYVNDWMDDIAIKDVNNDGLNDLIITQSGSNSSVKILYPSFNDYIFYSYIKVPAYNNTASIQIADFNNDGKNEIAAAHYGFNNVSVFSSKNNVFSNYQLFNCITTSVNSGSLDVGDVNNDGLQDIIVADYNTLSVLYNQSDVVMSVSDEVAKHITLYPNPASDYIRVRNLSVTTKFTITDYSGKIIKNGILNDTETIDLKNLTRGNYNINFLINNKTQNFKFIKK